ncbi:MAG TPA: hypothetical protein VJP45_07825 [Candidatus Limnocylindria bacterium]|nr:hypothetical protein [Candidatus Limnocylindria bacterium]
MNRGTHWGAVLFTLIAAGVLLSLSAGALFAPLRPAPTTAARTPAPTVIRTPLPEELRSQWHSQTAAPVIAVGATAEITIQYRNVGNTPWVKDSPSEIRLGEIGSPPLPAAMRVGWFAADRPAAQSEAVVDERDLATFTFKVIGTAPGTYRLRVRPVVDGVKWLEDEGVFVEITVRG